MKCVVNWIPLRIRVRSRSTHCEPKRIEFLGLYSYPTASIPSDSLAPQASTNTSKASMPCSYGMCAGIILARLSFPLRLTISCGLASLVNLEVCDFLTGGARIFGPLMPMICSAPTLGGTLESCWKVRSELSFQNIAILRFLHPFCLSSVSLSLSVSFSFLRLMCLPQSTARCCNIMTRILMH